MECLTCGRQNQDEKRFCVECGAPLRRTCPSCGGSCAPDERFCGDCGTEIRRRPPGSYTPKHLAEKILQSRSALEGERKQVTVLFGDVKGSMELAQQLDPEEWHRILDRFFAILTDGVHRFEGTVNQYTGDGIMALFGAPIAHEDHAQRACYAALHLRDRLRQYADELRVAPGVNFSFRLGLNSGEVIVGRIGDDLRMDYTAQGHTVGLAQRMEQLAPPGLPRIVQGALRCRVLRMVSEVQHQGDFEAQITETLELIQRADLKGWLPLVLLERAGLARLRGDADGMARDLAEARRLFAQMSASGWDDYARSIEA